MKKYIDIGSSPIKKKYEVSFNEKTCSFELKIKKEFFLFIKNSINKNLEEVFNNTAQNFGFKNQKFNLEKYFGINNCFKKVFEDKEWFLFSAPVKFTTGLSIVLTLVEIFPILEYVIDNEISESKNNEQDTFLSTACSKEAKFYGAVMSASLSVKFSLWLYHQDDKLRNQVNFGVNTAMAIVFKKIFKLKPCVNNSGLCGNGFLLSPPFGIYTCQFGIPPEEIENFTNSKSHGYKTFCHNLDTWQQQIVLLAGFAKICEAFRN